MTSVHLDYVIHIRAEGTICLTCSSCVCMSGTLVEYDTRNFSDNMVDRKLKVNGQSLAGTLAQ